MLSVSQQNAGGNANKKMVSLDVRYAPECSRAMRFDGQVCVCVCVWMGSYEGYRQRLAMSLV